METILKTTNLTKRFKEKIAVNKVNMTVRRGDIYGFIGKNGAGKTTTMKLILGTAFADEGQIELFGGEPPDRARKKIGSLIEAPGIYKNCSAFENMKRFAILSGGTTDGQIRDALRMVGLGDVGNKNAGGFSLGMKQRLGIALALLGEPEFLVLDEPINGLDPEGIKEIRDVILRLNREFGVTFLISSHLLDELAKVVTRYGIVNGGVLMEEITPEELNRRCESGLKIAADDRPAACAALKKYFAEKDVRNAGDAIMLPADTDAAKVNALLVKSGIAVRELTVAHGGFEEYFIRRIGG